MPVIFGTFKAAAYAMLFAIPGAGRRHLYRLLYDAGAAAGDQTGYRSDGALPTVVIGLVAGIWLAPIIEQYLLAVLALPLLLAAAVLLCGALTHRFMPRCRPGVDLLLLLPLLALTVWLALSLGPRLEVALFGEPLHFWLGDNYDQRNALVVGVAMGFALVPIIFSLAEDALFSVPATLSGALWRWAPQWQTVIKVVLPSASAGIFSALMIGFGRAVGETMIVLMATGNTPIIDGSLFQAAGAGGQYRHRDAGGGLRQQPLPRAVPDRAGAVCLHLRVQHAGGGGAPAAAQALHAKSGGAMKNWVKSGSPWIWLTAGSVAVSLLALIGILLLLAGQGMRYFWPSPVYQFELNQNGAGPVTVIGELYQQQSISRRQLAEAGVTPPGEAQSVERYLIKVGNREREGQDFRTLLASDIRSQSTPRGLLVLERDSHGTAYGYLAGLLEDGQPLTGRNLGQALQQRLPQIAALSRQAHDIQFRDMARINQQFDALRLREKRLQRDDKLDARAQDAIKAERLELQRQYQLLSNAWRG